MLGPGEVRLRRREDCAEDPDDAADLAGPTAEVDQDDADHARHDGSVHQVLPRNRRGGPQGPTEDDVDDEGRHQDRKSTRLNSSHVAISYAVFCLEKKTIE